MKRDLWFLLGCASCGYTFSWYVLRMNESWDEPFGWLALATLVLWIAHRRRHTDPASEPPASWWRLPSALLVAHGLSHAALPELLQCGIAALACTALACRVYGDGRLSLAALALALLALPSLGALDHVFSHPLRCAVAELSAILLSSNGNTVTCEGVALGFDGRVVLVDAPCSGIRMLWAGSFLTAALACLLGLEAWRTLRAFAIALVFVFLANVVRSSLLFLVEIDRLHVDLLTHDHLGALVFAFCAIAIVEVLRRIERRRRPCAS